MGPTWTLCQSLVGAPSVRLLIHCSFVTIMNYAQMHNPQTILLSTLPALLLMVMQGELGVLSKLFDSLWTQPNDIIYVIWPTDMHQLSQEHSGFYRMHCHNLPHSYEVFRRKVENLNVFWEDVAYALSGNTCNAQGLQSNKAATIFLAKFRLQGCAYRLVRHEKSINNLRCLTLLTCTTWRRLLGSRIDPKLK